MPPALASSSIENYDLLETIKAARRHGVASVQLYVDSSKYDEAYIDKLIEQLRHSDLGVVIHLRNHPKFNDPDLSFNEEDKRLVEKLIRNLPEVPFQVLMHYEDGMSVDDVPEIVGLKVGLENSKTRVFDPDHVVRAYNLSRECESFFVFDHGRIMYADTKEQAKSVILFIKEFIRQKLVPGRDIIHSADKTRWDLRFRDCWTYLGDKAGIGFPLIAALSEFSMKGGTVVFEHESLELAVKSVRTIET